MCCRVQKWRRKATRVHERKRPHEGSGVAVLEGEGAPPYPASVRPIVRPNPSINLPFRINNRVAEVRSYKRSEEARSGSSLLHCNPKWGGRRGCVTNVPGVTCVPHRRTHHQPHWLAVSSHINHISLQGALCWLSTHLTVPSAGTAPGPTLGAGRRRASQAAQYLVKGK